MDREVFIARFADLAGRIDRGRPPQHTGASRRRRPVDRGRQHGQLHQVHISVARGYDVTAYTLQCSGGGQHACLVADALRMTCIFIHHLTGVLSTSGMGLADQIAILEYPIELPLTDAGLVVRFIKLFTT